MYSFLTLFSVIRNLTTSVKPMFPAIITAKSPTPVFGGINDDNFAAFPARKFTVYQYGAYVFGMFPI